MTTDLKTLDAWWRAANYLAVGQIYLMDNPLLREPLAPEHIKPRLLGHWGTTPGLTFLWAHLNRVITRDALRALYITGPGHGGPAVVATAWMEGTYSELYSQVPQDADGMKELFRQFSFPGGIPSHAAPETPGSIHEGGELGYSLAHAYGAAFDNPDLLVACVIGDGEAETGPLAGSWQANKFVHPVHDGTVLPVLHLNGYKIANSTVLSRITRDELLQQLSGHGHRPFVVEGGFDGEDPMAVHERMAATLDEIVAEIARIREHAARQLAAGEPVDRPRWPALVLCTPKGWTGPREVDGVPVEGTWRAHQVPLAADAGEPRAPGPTGGVDALVPARGAVRRARHTPPRAHHLRAGRRRPDERQPARQRWPAAARPAPARLHPLRHRRRRARRCDRGRHGNAGHVARRRHPGEPAHLPHRRTGRDRLEPPAGRVRGHRPAVPGRHRRRPTSTSPSPGGSSRCCPNTCAKAGWRATSSPAATACSTATRRSSTSSTPCSTSTPSGSRPAAASRGGNRWPRSTTCSPATCGARTTTASPTRTPGSSTTS